MKKKSCYLVPGLHVLQHLMTSFDPDHENLIVASDVPGHNLLNFFKYVARMDNVVYLPEILYHTPHPDKLEIWGDIFKETAQIREKASRILDQIPTDADVYYFSPSTSISFFILLNMIRERSREQRIFLWKKQTPQMIHGVYEAKTRPLDEVQQRDYTTWSFLTKLGEAAGLRLAEIIHHLPGEDWERYVGHGPEDFFGETFLSPTLDWDSVREKLGIKPPQMVDGGILYIDSLLHERPEVDREKTQVNITRFMQKKMLEGKSIYVKAHYRSGGLTMISGTPVNDLVTHLPTAIPVELLMDAYDEVYFISSTSGGRPAPGKKFCLLDLVVFKTEDAAKNMAYLVEKNFGDELKTMNFVKPEDLE